jgi:hypothetical protein
VSEADTTSRLTAIQDEGAAASSRIKHKSREMRAFHQNIRKRITESTDPPPNDVPSDLAKVGSAG